MTSPGGAPSYDELARVTRPRVETELPGPRARAVLELDERVTSPSLPRAYPFVPARGAGAVLEDVDGNVFLDFNAGIAVCSTGHSHPAVVDAMASQAERLLHYSASDFYLPIYATVCERLDDLAPMSGPTRTFLCNSGTEGIEAAIKLARHHTRRQYVVGFLGSFHGRSYGSVSLTASSAKYHAGFGPLLPGVVHAPYAERTTSWIGLSDDDARSSYLEDVVFKRLVPPDEIAAVVVEPVLGEGGYVIPPAAWVRRLRELCDEHGILLVADEVQSGMGRTGKTWAIEHFGVEPDVVVSGKGIASGMPLGATIARAELMTWDAGAHGSTYGGNPVSCAAALATFDLVEKELAANAAHVGGRVLEALHPLARRHDVVAEVRGLGLMIGVEMTSPEAADDVELACYRRGLLVLRAGDATVRISPPLVLSEAQADEGVRIFDDACAEVAAARR